MIGKYFFESEEVEIEFDLPVERAIKNLDFTVAAPGKALSGKEDSMVGSVAQNTVYIYRAVPGSRNSFRPSVYGKFVGRGDKAILIGEITLNRVIQKFIVLWCAVVSISAVWTLITVLRNPAASWGSLIYIVCMLIACIIFFRFMVKKTSTDRQWLKREISRAVTHPDYS